MKCLATISLAFIILIGSACKKEKDKPASLDKIAGEYPISQVIQLSPYIVTPLPNQAGTYGKFVIISPKSDSAIITFFLYDKNNKELDNDPWYCHVTQNADGEIMLTEGNYLAAFIRPGYNMDFVGYKNELDKARKK
jgi:hypothetical protein